MSTAIFSKQWFTNLLVTIFGLFISWGVKKAYDQAVSNHDFQIYTAEQQKQFNEKLDALIRSDYTQDTAILSINRELFIIKIKYSEKWKK